MRRKVILIQYLTLLLLGVLVGAVFYYGKDYCPIISRGSLNAIDSKEFASRLAHFFERVMQWKQQSGVIRFIQLNLNDEWLLFAIPILLGIILATILSVAIICFVREKSVTVEKPETNRKTKSKQEEVEKKASDAVELLTCLQKKGRLIDFLKEDISSYDDAQVGAAVRSIHQNTQKVLEKMVSIEPVMTELEGDPVRIEAGFDPSAIRLTGNIKGDPPFSGTVCHRGWKVTQIKIDNRPQTHDLNIIEPSEVEIA